MPLAGSPSHPSGPRLLLGMPCGSFGSVNPFCLHHYTRGTYKQKSGKDTETKHFIGTIGEPLIEALKRLCHFNSQLCFNVNVFLFHCYLYKRSR